MRDERIRIITGKISVFLDDIYSWFRGLVYKTAFRGSEYTCPLCNHSFSRFLPVGYKHQVLKDKEVIGGSYRKNSVCPVCSSTDRDRLVYLFITSRQLLRPPMRLLHIAPEKKLQRVIKQSGIEYVSADLSSPLAAVKMDILDIGFPDNYFDAIICNHVLEHIIDDGRAMKELFRVLRKGGWAILQVPFSPVLERSFEDPSVTSLSDRQKVFGQNNHVRIYGKDYTDRLKAAGFSVAIEKMDTSSIEKFALNPREAIFFCTK